MGTEDIFCYPKGLKFLLVITPHHKKKASTFQNRIMSLIHHNLVDEDEGVVAVLGHVVADGFVLDVAGLGGDGSA